MEPFISRIRVYPIKSLDPIELEHAEVGVKSLRYDREFALLTDNDRFFNGKRSAKVYELKATYDLKNYTVNLVSRAGGISQTFHLLHDKGKLEEFLIDFFGEPINLIHNTTGRLMDIPDISSVTVVSKASLESLHSSFPDKTLEDMRLRFRTNIELDGVDPYWEEKLISEPGMGIRFTIGEVEMIGISPRARCNVPPRNPFTGETDKTFVKKMLENRKDSLPKGSFIPIYGSLYHLTVNTFLPESQKGKWIHLGDPVKIIGPMKLT